MSRSRNRLAIVLSILLAAGRPLAVAAGAATGAATEFTQLANNGELIKLLESSGVQVDNQLTQITQLAEQIENQLRIYQNMASRLSEQLPQSSGPLKLADETSDFAIALATSLKTSGYRIASGTQPQPQTIALAYRLDRSGSELLASLSTPRLRLARLYLVSGSQATPASPLSVMILQ